MSHEKRSFQSSFFFFFRSNFCLGGREKLDRCSSRVNSTCSSISSSVFPFETRRIQNKTMKTFRSICFYPLDILLDIRFVVDPDISFVEDIFRPLRIDLLDYSNKLNEEKDEEKVRFFFTFFIDKTFC